MKGSLPITRLRSRGMAVKVVITVGIVLVAFVFLFVDVFIKMMFFDQAAWVKIDAESAAKSAASTAVAALVEDTRFGESPTDEIVIAPGELSPHQSAYVQFDPENGKPYSINNMHSDAVVRGYGGTPVPAYGAQIIAVGSYGGRDVLYEVILVRPGITHAAASSGELVLNGKNEAASLKTLEQLVEMTNGGLVNSDAVEDKFRHTTVASSMTSGEPLILKGELTLFGDAISGAGIKQEGEVQFLHGGLPRAYSSQVEIPVIDDITQYDPAALDGTTDLDPSYNDASNLFQGRNRANGDLVINGDVDLNGALLYATGDIRITGSVKGEGAIIAAGDVTITGQADVQADSKVAIIAGEDLTLTGTGADRSLFGGLVYAEGKLNAGNISIVGGLVANNPDNPEQASVEVTDARLINLPEKTQFDVKSSLSNPVAPPPRAGLYGRKLGLMERDGFTMVLPDINDYVGPDGLWTGETPVFRIEYQGQVYDRPEDIPGITLEMTTRLNGNLGHAEAVWLSTLESLEPQSAEISVFQLDPNQLLTVSGGYKVVLRRPLDGWYTTN